MKCATHQSLEIITIGPSWTWTASSAVPGTTSTTSNSFVVAHFCNGLTSVIGSDCLGSDRNKVSFVPHKSRSRVAFSDVKGPDSEEPVVKLCISTPRNHTLSSVPFKSLILSTRKTLVLHSYHTAANYLQVAIHHAKLQTLVDGPASEQQNKVSIYVGDFASWTCATCIPAMCMYMWYVV